MNSTTIPYCCTCLERCFFCPTRISIWMSISLLDLQYSRISRLLSIISLDVIFWGVLHFTRIARRNALGTVNASMPAWQSARSRWKSPSRAHSSSRKGRTSIASWEPVKSWIISKPARIFAKKLPTKLSNSQTSRNSKGNSSNSAKWNSLGIGRKLSPASTSNASSNATWSSMKGWRTWE